MATDDVKTAATRSVTDADPGETAPDWIDEADGVFRGGGVKGLGLAGALLGFAEHPTKPIARWVNVAGASSGAIIASYLALGKRADEATDVLRSVPLETFKDFPRGGKFIGGGLNLLFGRHGLARGKVFRDWFDDLLGHATFESLKDDEGRYRLRMTAVDVTRRRLLVLPDDLTQYRLPRSSQTIDLDRFPVADAVRMSMAIPYFFEPVELVHAETYRSSLIVDGGTLSNFPVWLFDVDPRERGRPPRRPTIGFTLVGDPEVAARATRVLRYTPWPVRFAYDIFATAQEAWDERFVSYSTRVRTVAVDAGAIRATDFDLTPEQEAALLISGRSAASDFLDRFDLGRYVNTFHARIARAGAPSVGDPGRAGVQARPETSSATE